MTDESILHDGINANLRAMHQILVTASHETYAACLHIEGRQQNMAIGTIIVVDDLLAQATALYKAIIALHRCKL